MIYMGNDIVEVSRIHSLLERYHNRFLDKIFSYNEINIINQKRFKSMHFAGKFSAKEASKKALLSAGLAKDIYFKDIEILNENSGAPYVQIKKIDMSLFKSFQVSISHTNYHATAIAIIEL